MPDVVPQKKATSSAGAGTDVWHDTGSRDFWHLQGPPYADLRACAYAFYLLFAVLIGSLVLQVASTPRRATR